MLTHAAVTDEPLAGTLARLQPFAEEVLATEAERLAEMAAALPPLEGSPADLPAASIALLEAVGAVRRDASLRRAEELLALQMLDTESFSASRLAQELPGVLLGLAVEDRDAKALDLLVHWEKLAARAGLDRGDRAGKVLTRLLRDENDQSAADHEAALRLGLAGLQEERLTPRVEEWLIGAVSSRLDALITARMLEPGDDPQRGRGFRAAAGRLDAVLGGLNPRLLLPGFLEEAENTYAGDGMEKLRAEVLDANPGSVEGDGTAAGVAAAVLRLAVTLEEPDRAAGRDERLEANASALRAVLGDVSLSRPLRLAIIAPVLGRMEALAPPAVVDAAAGLLVACLEDPAMEIAASTSKPLLAAVARRDRRPAEGTDAADLAGAYIAALLRAEAADPGSDRVDLPWTEEVTKETWLKPPTAALLALDLALAGGLDGAADGLLAAEGEELGACPAAWLSLLRHDRAGRAAALIRDASRTPGRWRCGASASVPRRRTGCRRCWRSSTARKTRGFGCSPRRPSRRCPSTPASGRARCRWRSGWRRSCRRRRRCGTRRC